MGVMKMVLQGIINEVKSYHPEAIKANWQEIDERKLLIEKLSDHYGLKKVYFDALPPEQFAMYKEGYDKWLDERLCEV